MALGITYTLADIAASQRMDSISLPIRFVDSKFHVCIIQRLFVTRRYGEPAPFPSYKKIKINVIQFLNF